MPSGIRVYGLKPMPYIAAESGNRMTVRAPGKSTSFLLTREGGLASIGDKPNSASAGQLSVSYIDVV